MFWHEIRLLPRAARRMRTMATSTQTNTAIQIIEKPRVWAVGSELDERKVNASAAKIPASIGTRSFGSNQ
jgi:hypothetical protein